MEISEFAEKLGIATCVDFDPALIIPEEEIRTYCQENRCGSYNNNFMCPPRVGSLDDIRTRLQKYRRSVLLQYVIRLDVGGDRQAVRQTKIDFHQKILQIEEFMREQGIDDVWAFIGGSCGLCEICKAAVDEPCPYPEKARTSLEAIAVNVVDLLDKLGLDSQFHSDRITWTGCILN